MLQKGISRWIVIIIVALCVAVFFGLSLNPLRGSEEKIEKYILTITPIGTSYEQALKSIDDRHWEIYSASKEHGFYDQRHRPSITTGAMSIRASLGDYQDIPFEANVTVYWGFDETGYLTDIWVWKTWDAI